MAKRMTIEEQRNQGHDAVINAKNKLNELNAHGCKQFQIYFKIRRKGTKYDVFNFKYFSDAMNSISEVIKTYGVEKISNIIVHALNVPIEKCPVAILPANKSSKKKPAKTPKSSKEEDNPYAYKPITVRDLVKFVEQNKGTFPKGLDTPLLCGDDECNATHQQFGFQQMDVKDTTAVVLTYEMHEGML